MQTLTITREDKYAIVQLDRGKSNPINTQMLKELKQCFDSLVTEADVEGVVLTGKLPFFSAGLDVIELYNYNDEEIADLFQSLFDAIKAMLSFPKPIVASITGHSPAGGCVLALCCDYRVMADGKYRIGLNEVPVGIVMPEFIYHLYADTVGYRQAKQFILEGKLLSVNEALDAGLVDQVVQEDQVFGVALGQLQKYLSLNQRTWRFSKLNMRKSLLTHYTSLSDDAKKEILTHWWSEDTRKILGGLVAHLTKK